MSPPATGNSEIAGGSSSLVALLHQRLAMIALRTLRHNIKIGPGKKGLVPEAAMATKTPSCGEKSSY